MFQLDWPGTVGEHSGRVDSEQASRSNVRVGSGQKRVSTPLATCMAPAGACTATVNCVLCLCAGKL